MGKPFSLPRGTTRSIFLVACLICVVVSFGIHAFSTGEYPFNSQLFGSQHAGDSDHDAWSAYSIPLLVIALFLTRMDIEKPIVHSIISIPQLPPPKVIA